MEINVEIIKELIAGLNASSFDTLRLETKEFKLAIERNAPHAVSAAPAVEINTAAVAVPAVKEDPQVQPCSGTLVKSPIVGTFYASSSPDKPPFVKVGQQVEIGDTIYIVESMKLMNEVASECSGTIAEILVENGQTVEYGQPIMRIE